MRIFPSVYINKRRKIWLKTFFFFFAKWLSIKKVKVCKNFILRQFFSQPLIIKNVRTTFEEEIIILRIRQSLNNKIFGEKLQLVQNIVLFSYALQKIIKVTKNVRKISRLRDIFLVFWGGRKKMSLEKKCCKTSQI